MEPNGKRIAIYPALAQVPGLVFRHFAGEEDFQIVLDIWIAAQPYYGIEDISTLEDIKSEHDWHKNYDIHQQFLIVELDNMPIGYFTYNWDTDETNHALILDVGFVLLREYWETPIASLILRYQEEKLDKMTENQLAGNHRFLDMWMKKKADFMVDFFENHGYIPTRYFIKLSRPTAKPIVEYPMPEGLKIREVMPEHYRMIWDADNEAFRGQWGHSEPTEEQYQSWLRGRNFDPSLWKVAWDSEEVAGVVINYTDDEENRIYQRKRGTTKHISTGMKWRGRGIAKALLAESIRMFTEMGFEETILGVDAKNPSGALKLYTSMGYEENKSQTSVVMRKKI